MIYFAIYTDLIENSSISRFVLSNLGKKMKNIVILSHCQLPSWFFGIHYFLENLSSATVTLLLPSLTLINLLGASRDNRISFRKFDIDSHTVSSCPSWITTLLKNASLVLCHSSIHQVSSFLNILNSAQAKNFAFVLSGSLRMRKLSKFPMTWRRIQHHKVGGCTTGCFWLGSSIEL